MRQILHRKINDALVCELSKATSALARPGGELGLDN